MSLQTSKKSKAKPESWLSLLSDAVRTAEKKPTGPGWKTFDEIREETGVGEFKARRLMAALCRDGKLEKFMGSILRDGSLIVRVWYRQKKARPQLRERAKPRGR